MKNIAIIPARSGSKGLKDKNIKLLAGKPLMAYSIEAAINSGICDVVMVSTDSSKYAEIAKEYGAEVPFLRSEENSSDTASSWAVVKEILRKYEEKGERFDNVFLLQPTSPLRDAEEICNAYKLFIEKKANLVDSVTEMEHSPIWSNTLPNDLSLKNFRNEKYKGMPRQMLPQFYRENGAIYILNIPFFLQTTDIMSERAYAYIMEKKKSIDVDDEFDFLLAEIIIKNTLDRPVK